MRIYNSLTDKVEEFKPINEGKVTMYVCGPTVYNYVHIGNMRPVITFDMVYKYLKYLGYDVKYASNYTDINPKITRAAETLGITEREVADKFIKAYEEDLKNYNCSNIDYRPRVINYLDDIFNFISKLIEKGWIREQAYDVIQPLAFKALNEKIPFKDLVVKENLLTVMEAKELFDLNRYLKNVDAIIDSVGIRR